MTDTVSSPATAMPSTWTLVPDHALRTKDSGQTLIGGAPMGIIRLSEAGATIAKALFRGEAIGDPSARADLARRLIDRGMAHPEPGETSLTTLDLTVIIPVHDDQDGLHRTLAALPPVAKVVVVDDASTRPFEIEATAAPSPVVVRRSDVNLGPGGARNLGLAEVETAFVLFLDADVVVDGATLGSLLAYFADNEIVAVGPRIVPRSGVHDRNALDRYERGHSPLDLGERPSPVRPGAAVSYLPTACLFVRRQALREVGPFDPALRYGEDVDLIWRLRSVGTVRYVPRIVATHPNRSTVAAFLRQRVGYGSAAGPLGTRHGAAVAPLRASGWTLAVLALGLGGHGGLGLLLHAGTTRALVPKLGRLGDPLVEATRLTTTGNVWAARTLARSGLRTWWPVLVIGLAFPPTRRLAGRWLRWSVIERVVTERETDPRLMALGLLDDLGYGTGVWLGALRSRSLVALCPATNDQSTSGRFTIKSSNWTTSRVSTLRKRISALRSS